jgi:hypothetical protein
MANPSHPGVDSHREWLELYNDGDAAIDLLGWMIEDDGGADFLSAHVVQPGAFVIVAAGQGFQDEYPDYDGAVLVIADGSIGNGLSNTGDEVVLRDRSGSEVDALSYGTNRRRFDPAAPLSGGGASIERTVTQMEAEFVVNHFPSPGVPYEIRVIPLPQGNAEVETKAGTAGPTRVSLVDVTPIALLFGVPLFMAARKSRIHR